MPRQGRALSLNLRDEPAPIRLTFNGADPYFGAGLGGKYGALQWPPIPADFDLPDPTTPGR